jgi:hypothetical protein
MPPHPADSSSPGREAGAQRRTVPLRTAAARAGAETDIGREISSLAGAEV